MRCKVAMRWLGVWFDLQLDFTCHVEERIATAKRAVQHLQRVSVARLAAQSGERQGRLS